MKSRVLNYEVIMKKLYIYNDKLLSKIDLKKVLLYCSIFIPALVITILNYSIANKSLTSQVINITLKGKTNNIVAKYAIFMTIVRLIYNPLIFLALTMIMIRLINFTRIHKPKSKKDKEKVIKELSVYPDTIPYNQTSNSLEMHIGVIHNYRNLDITEHGFVCTLTEKNILKNILILGIIGEGKTAANMLVYLRQAIYYNANLLEGKCGGMVTDVKGNFAKYVVDFCKDVGRDDDIILFRLVGEYFINFLYKPEEPAMILASRFSELLKVNSESGNDGYWIDLAEKLIANGIILARLYFDEGYFTFEDLDSTIVDDNRRKKIIKELDKRQKDGLMSKYNEDLFISAKRYFKNKYETLGDKIKGIIMTEVDRLIGAFTSDPLVKYTFCPPKEKLNFPSFKSIINEGKIFIIDVPEQRFKVVAKLANTFCKLEHQTQVIMRLSDKNMNQDRPCFFLSDENHKICTPGDADFYSLAREARHFSILSTQSISSYMTVLKNKSIVNNMLNNLDNKLFMRNTDPETLDYCLKVIGKEVKTYTNKSTSESGKTDIDYLSANVSQENKSISTSHSEIERKEEIFTQEFFSRILDEFKAVGILNSGKVLAPIHLFKDWENRITGGVKLLKAEVKNEFIYTPYMSTPEMIDVINNDGKEPPNTQAEDIDGTTDNNDLSAKSRFVLSDEDRKMMEKAKANKQDVPSPPNVVEVNDNQVSTMMEEEYRQETFLDIF